MLRHAKGTSKSFDGGTRSLDRGKLVNSGGNSPTFNNNIVQSCDEAKDGDTPDEKPCDFTEDSVPGLLYDLLQKEVIGLRKAVYEKDQSLKDKDDAIEVCTFFFFFRGEITKFLAILVPKCSFAILVPI